jgi:hypothetical protein
MGHGGGGHFGGSRGGFGYPIPVYGGYDPYEAEWGDSYYTPQPEQKTEEKKTVVYVITPRSSGFSEFSRGQVDDIMGRL